MSAHEATEPAETVRRAVAMIAELREDAAACPPGADRFDWSADVLDELARLVCAIAPTVEHVTGRANDILATRADEMATAIVAHRNALMRTRGLVTRQDDGAA